MIAGLIVSPTPSTYPLETLNLPCTRLVITAGAWTPRVLSTLFPTSSLRLPITSLAGHSLVLRTPRWTAAQTSGCHAVFTSDAAGYSPELFSRAGGEIYIAGLNDAAIPLPPLATGRKIDPRSIAVLKRTAQRLLGQSEGEELEQAVEVLREGLCFRPVTARGTPIIDRLDPEKLGAGASFHEGGGVWIAAGHGPWGISLSLGTGRVLGEMVEGKETSVDVRGLKL